jgi:hypothetical protein
MKVNEVLVEGPLNWFTGYHPGFEKSPRPQEPKLDNVDSPEANPTITDPSAKNGPAHDAAKHDLAPGVQVISQEPIVIKYKNKDYALNDKGQWIPMAGGKIPHQSFQEFLSQQHDRSLNIQQTRGDINAKRNARRTIATQTTPQPKTNLTPPQPNPAVFRNRNNPRFTNAPVIDTTATNAIGGNTGTPPSPAPAVTPAKPRTGGRKKGELSQTPNAIRKRNARQIAADRKRLLPDNGNVGESIDLGQVLWNKIKRIK